MDKRKGQIMRRGLPLQLMHRLLLGFVYAASEVIPYGLCQADDNGFKDFVEQSNKSFNASLVASIVVSIVFVLIVGGALFYCLCIVDKRIKTPHIGLPSKNSKSDAPTPDLEMNSSSSVEIRNRLQKKQFRYAEVLEITENMRVKLGEGGFGPVYYGKLKDGTPVAVKMLSSASHQGTEEFLNEVEILSRAHHKNLVSLLGYCCEMNARCLIYEFMSKGTLDDRLHGLPSEEEPLSWPARLKIAVGAAKGFNYLHNDCHPAIIHRDVKCSNILLDGKLAAKVADFGLSKLLSQSDLRHITTDVKGTFGYLDPEYQGTKQLTEKSDVYSFGVILLELLTGKKAVMQHDGHVEYISEWARPYIATRNYNNILDQKMGEIDMDKRTVEAVASIALQCVASKNTERPYVQEVLEVLEAALKQEVLPQAADVPTNTSISVDILMANRAVSAIIGGANSVEKEMIMLPHKTI